VADANTLIKGYGLGSGGVNVVKSPLHLDDNELTKAQNAVPDNTSGLGSIRKRDGLVALNAVALSGAVTGIVGLPLPDFGAVTRTMYAALGNATANTWKKSTDGTTWTDATSPVRAQRRTKLSDPSAIFFVNNRMVAIDHRLLFPNDNYIQYPTASSDAPPYNMFDGTNDTTIAQIPFNPGSGATPGTTDSYYVTDSCLHKGELYIGVFDPVGGSPNRNGRVFKLDYLNGTLTQIGNAFGDGADEVVGGMPWALCSYQGLLYVGVYGITGAGVGRVYKINTSVSPGTWTEDNPTGSPLNGYITSMRQWQGDLYIACMEDDGATASVIFKRTAAGVYSVVKTGTGIDGGNYWAVLGEFGDTPANTNLYACNINTSGTPDTNEIWRCDVSGTWTLDKDVFAAYAQNLHVGQMVVFGGAMYIVYPTSSDSGVDGFILKRTAAGTYTRPLTGANLRGFIETLVVET
jgi:hypothetical protein